MARTLFLVFLFLFSCTKGEEKQIKPAIKNVRDVKISKRFFEMSTITDCILYTTENDSSLLFHDTTLNKLWNSTDSILSDWNKRFSTDSINSEIYKINHRQQSNVQISEELYHMLAYIKNFDKKHPKLFDPTIRPLKKFWKPTCTNCKTPTLKGESTKHQISQILSKVDFSKVSLLRRDDHYIVSFSSPEITLEVGGIAKGFVLNKLKNFYTQKGYNNFVISMGGDIYAKGGKPSGKPFVLGIQNPDDSKQPPLSAKFNFHEGTVVTSGNYERFRLDANGDRVHHIYALQDGYPSQHNKSVTIIAQNPTVADIYSTALFSLPSDSILTIVNNTEELECFIIDMNNIKSMSDGFFHLLR